jgi:hypothetical protein
MGQFHKILKPFCGFIEYNLYVSASHSFSIFHFIFILKYLTVSSKLFVLCLIPNLGYDTTQSFTNISEELLQKAKKFKSLLYIKLFFIKGMLKNVHS